MTTDKVRSSSAAISCRSRFSESLRRIVISLIFFSSMIQPKKYRHRQGWRAGVQKTPKRRMETLVESMSGGLFGWAVGAAQIGPIDIGPGQLEIHQARLRYSAPLPLRNGAQSNATKCRYGLCSAKPFDDFCLLHATTLAH